MSISKLYETLRHWKEGKLQADITASSGASNLDLAKGTTGQIVHEVFVSCPGAAGDLTVTFYDGTDTTIPISGTLYLASQPSSGFVLDKTVSTGTLGWVVGGYSSGAKKGYVHVAFGY